MHCASVAALGRYLRRREFGNRAVFHALSASHRTQPVIRNRPEVKMLTLTRRTRCGSSTGATAAPGCRPLLTGSRYLGPSSRSSRNTAEQGGEVAASSLTHGTVSCLRWVGPSLSSSSSSSTSAATAAAAALTSRDGAWVAGSHAVLRHPRSPRVICNVVHRPFVVAVCGGVSEDERDRPPRVPRVDASLIATSGDLDTIRAQ